MNRHPSRRGFTRVEVLIAVVLLGIVGLGMSRLLSSQMRFFQRSTGARDARAVSRNATNLLRSEMRMIEPLGITAATTTSITANIPYAMGVYCSASTVTFMPIAPHIATAAQFAGYAYRDTALNAPFTYVSSSTAMVDGLSASCTTGAGITPVALGTVKILSPTLPLLAAGSPVFAYQTVTYSLAPSTLVPGRTALWRTVAGGGAEELAVPFDAASAFRFYVSGGTTSQAAPPGTLSSMSGVELVLTAESERNSPGTGAPESSDARISIFFRNAVN